MFWIIFWAAENFLETWEVWSSGRSLVFGAALVFGGLVCVLVWVGVWVMVSECCGKEVYNLNQFYKPQS